MWYLKELPQKDPKPGPKYWLGGITGKGRTIGRKHVDIRLKASSVSRKHAEISILKAAFYTPSTRRRSTSVSVKDSSAYGTFLKYPPDHALNRGQVAGHHRRLDKDTPTDVCEDALLAFGAPSSWWKVMWYPAVVCPTRLSVSERTRLDEIASATSLEVADAWSEDVTHLITNRCVPTSFKFLTAVAFNRQIVTPAWVEAVNLVVTEACTNITEVGTEEAAIVETNLPEEKLFAPPFSFESLTIPRAILTTALEPPTRKAREALFEGITFAFAREERRSLWALIINQLKGCAMLAQSIKSRSEPPRPHVVFVREDGKESEVDSERPWVPESSVIEAILAASRDPLQGVLGQSAAAEMTDIATPAPLDAESDAESDESDKSQQGPDQRQIEEMGSNSLLEGQRPVRKVLGSRRLQLPSDSPHKRSRRSSCASTRGAQKGTRTEKPNAHSPKPFVSDAPGDVVQNQGVEGEGDDQQIDHTSINQRAFFTLSKPSSMSPDRAVERMAEGALAHIPKKPDPKVPIEGRI